MTIPETTAYDYVALGFNLQFLRSIQFHRDLKSGGSMFLEQLDKSGFKPAIDQAGRLRAGVNATVNAIANNPLAGNSAIQNRNELLAWVDPIQTALFAESKSRKLSTILESEAADNLQPLLAKSNHPLFTTLIEEAISSLRHGNYRSAIVMVWSAVIEQLRQYILGDTNRKKAFNDEIVKPRGKKQYDPVKDYDDFFEVTDWLLLDVAKKADLIDKHTFEVLDAARKRRNHYGHPTLVTALPSTANHLVDDLRVNIIEKFPLPMVPTQAANV